MKNDFMKVEYKTYLYNDEKFTVRKDFWDVFEACPDVQQITEKPISIGVGRDDFTQNKSNLGVVWTDTDKDMMLISRPSMY